MVRTGPLSTDRPLNTAAYHARRAEDLTATALGSAMAGWLRRGRRRELLAAAQVHATLAVASLPTEEKP